MSKVNVMSRAKFRDGVEHRSQGWAELDVLPHYNALGHNAVQTFAVTTTETTTDETTVAVTKLVIDEKGSTSYEFYKASSGPIRSSLEAVAVSLIATIFVLRF